MATSRRDGMDDGIGSLKVVSEQIPANYGSYLRSIQDRNRRLRHLKEKPSQDIAHERKEQGFSLYFSGANSHRHPKVVQQPPVTDCPDYRDRSVSQRKAKSSGSKRLPDSSGDVEQGEEMTSYRAKTAPNTARKGWSEGNKVKIKTEHGDTLNIRAPDAYSEDFDMDSDTDDTENETVDRVLLSIDDVKALRRSLKPENNFSITSMINEELEHLEERDESEASFVDKLIDEEISNLEKASSKEQTIVLEFQPTGKTCLASSRKEPHVSLDSSKVSDLAIAVASENKTVKKVESSHTAVPKENTDRIQVIIDRVIKLSAIQQQKLIDTLETVESTLCNDECDDVSKKSAFVEHPAGTNLFQPTETIVTVELLSNWGHPSKIGLTEFEIFDSNESQLQVLEVGTDGCAKSDSLKNLIDGKSRTTKEMRMWSNEFYPGKVIKLTFRIAVQENTKLGKFIVWNFNKSLNDLDVGVRECKIFIDRTLVFDGDLEKGCGNPAFNYGQTILVHSLSKLPNPLPVRDSNNSGLSVSSQGDKNKTTKPVNKSSFEPTSSDSSGRGASGSSYSDGVNRKLDITPTVACNVPKSTSDDLLSAASLHRSSEKMRRSNQTSERRSTDKERSFADARDSVSKSGTSMLSPRVSDTKPTQVSDKLKVEKKSISAKVLSPRYSKEKAITSSNKVHADDDHVTCSTDDDCLFNKIQEFRKQREEKKAPSWLRKEDEQRKDTNKSENLAEIPENVQKSTNLLVEDQENDRADQPTPMQKIEESHKRRRKRQETALALEESWNSLNFFNRCHAGRISTDVEGDVLDKCLSGRKSSGNKEDVAPSKVHNSLMCAKEMVTEEDDSGWSDDEFYIPELPSGFEMKINIRSTWGDRHYVGLTGIELFQENGERVKVTHIRADPPDINILPGYGKDPRVVSNVIDGVNKTRDDFHMWLTPFTNGANHLVYLTFEKPCHVALMRLWNYNKSRIHSSRGARHIEISMDNSFIFKGEIARGCGSTSGGTDAFGETILFTTDDAILEMVAQHDDAFSGIECSSSDEEGKRTAAVKECLPTVDTSEDEECESDQVDLKKERPFTCAKTSKKHRAVATTAPGANVNGVYSLKRLQLNFTGTWGDRHYLGLTGLELIGPSSSTVPLLSATLSANPRDMTILKGCENDERTLDKLVDGTCVTVEDQHMWMIPFTEDNDHVVEISFPAPVQVAGMRIWNYNKSPEDTYRGAKVVHVIGDEQVISPSNGFLLRKAPGHCQFDFAQEIVFADTEKFSNAADDFDSDARNLPCGFVYQFNLFCSWNDQYYVGLNGIEFFDGRGKKMNLTSNNIAAYPDSVNALGRTTSDVRTPDKVIDGVNDTTDGRHMWLAPILPSVLNKLFVIFDYPVSISMVRLWNYSKTSGRGVKNFSILVDDLLFYSGTLPSVPAGARGILPTCAGSQAHYTVLFDTSNSTLFESEKHALLKSEPQDQDVMLTNDHQIVTHYTKPQHPPNQDLRPMTGVCVKPGPGVGGPRRGDDRHYR